MRVRAHARTCGAHAVDDVAREPEGHQLGRVQEAALLEGHAQVYVHHLCAACKAQPLSLAQSCSEAQDAVPYHAPATLRTRPEQSLRMPTTPTSKRITAGSGGQGVAIAAILLKASGLA